ncbi:MAG TPA: biliverdin-producing heme oxygenase [Magnetospirillum sp.]|nr:biliverdin-producing heme oxygenase [Magnetospirillum sp.]
MNATWQSLRQATQPMHQQLERVPVLARLFADDCRRDELALVLKGMAMVHGGLEPMLERSQAARAIGYRPRLPLLRAALAALEHALPEGHCTCDVSLHAPAREWGALYVVEGAILGGEVIRRRLIDQFGESIAPALAFFTPYGSQAGAQWVRFRDGLARHAAPPDALAEAVDAAAQTFALFAQVLTGMHKIGG